jgi:hypothetical protein
LIWETQKNLLAGGGLAPVLMFHEQNIKKSEEATGFVWDGHGWAGALLKLARWRQTMAAGKPVWVVHAGVINFSPAVNESARPRLTMEADLHHPGAGLPQHCSTSIPHILPTFFLSSFILWYVLYYRFKIRFVIYIPTLCIFVRLDGNESTWILRSKIHSPLLIFSCFCFFFCTIVLGAGKEAHHMHSKSYSFSSLFYVCLRIKRFYPWWELIFWCSLKRVGAITLHDCQVIVA